MRQAPESAGSEAQSASTDALHNPVKRTYTKREYSNTEMPRRALDAIEDPVDREAEIIVADAESGRADYLAELAFMEEPLTIIIQRGREKHAPTHEMVSVNGRGVWLPVGQRVRVQRKYVEVIARAQPQNVSTDSGESPGDDLTFNRVLRDNSSAIAFSVLEDPNPRGKAWLQEVMRSS